MAVSNNKYARQAEQRTKKAVHDPKLTIDEQLNRLEEDVRRLKVEFDIYFNGGAKRPPYDTKNRVESIIKRLADERSLSFAERYRYNSVVARYNSFRELWRRTIQDREEGRGPTAAKTQMRIDAAPPADRTAFVCADAHRDVTLIKEVYDALVAAKKKCGEPTDDFSFARFHRMVAAKTDALKERLGCERVQFSVDVKDGRVSFKAKGDT